jgi:O-antigen ligase
MKINIRGLDFRLYATISLLALWASTTFSIALMEISTVCALIFWILGKTGVNPEQRWAAPRIDWALWAPLTLFFALVLVSLVTSEYPKQSFRGLFKIAKPLLVFIMAADLFRNSASMKRFEGVFLAIFLIVTMDCAAQYAFGKDILRGFAPEYASAGIRLVGPFGNFAKMSTYLVLVIPVFAMIFWSDFAHKEHRKRSFYGLALALAGLTLLYLTRCRGPVVALALAFGILFIYKRWFKTLGIALLLGLTVLTTMVPRHVLIHEDAEGKEQSLVERFELWKRALHVIEVKPWTGTGINTYNVAHAKYDTTQNWRVRGYYAHNGYLQLAAEIGLPGIFCFFWFLFMFFRRSLQAIRRVRGSPEELLLLGYSTGLLAFLIYAAFDNNLQSPPSLMMFWYLAGITLALTHAGANSKINPQQI